MLVLAAAMLGSHTATARAYDEGNCAHSVLKLVDADRFRIEGGRADFGDLPHVGGAPQGTAVVCWYRPGTQVFVFGRLFADSLSRTCVSARIDYITSTVTTTHVKSVCGGLAQSIYVQDGIRVREGEPRNVQALRARLFVNGAPVASRTVFRGD